VAGDSGDFGRKLTGVWGVFGVALEKRSSDYKLGR